MKVKNQLALIYSFITYSVSKETVKVRTKEITTIRLGGSPFCFTLICQAAAFPVGSLFPSSQGWGTMASVCL